MSRSRQALVPALNCSSVFPALPLNRRPAAARAAGFGEIESWWPFGGRAPSPTERTELRRALDDAATRVTALGIDHGDIAKGDRGLLCSRSRFARLDRGVDAAIDLARTLGAPTLTLLVGIPDEGEPDPIGLAATRLADFGLRAAEADLRIVIEPLSGSPGYPVRTLAQATGLLERVEQIAPDAAVGILVDLYHLAVNESDPEGALRAAATRIHHVQVADHPGRGAPGTGDSPLHRWVGVAREDGYAGTLGLEFTPGHEGLAHDFELTKAWLRGIDPSH